MRIGVSGHRDPVDLDSLKEEIRRVVTRILGVFPTSENTVVIVEILSSLAEGADRLVIDETLDLLGPERMRVHAVLPMSKERYEEDFEPLQSRPAFEHLLESATVTALPGGPDRPEAYERAGRWVAEHSDVLVALWDGHHGAGRGGTAEIVRYARRRGIPVVVISTARQSEPDRPTAPVEPPGDLARDLGAARTAFARVEEFNRAPIADSGLQQRTAGLAARLGAAADGTSIQWQYERVAEWALPRLARADALAGRYQRLHYRAGDALYGFAALAVTAAAAQAEFGLHPRFALIEAALMLALVAVYRVAHHQCFHERWIGYRSLAEAFRSALFIVLLGTEGLGSAAIDGTDERSDAWFQRTFSEAFSERLGPTPEPADPAAVPSRRSRGEIADLRRYLEEAWIDDQIAYHRSAVRRFRDRYTLVSRTLLALFAATILMALLHAFEVLPEKPWSHIFMFLAVALPAFGGALIGIREQRQYKLHAQRSERAEMRLTQLKRTSPVSNDQRSVQRLAAQAQAIIEAETLDWSGVVEFEGLELIL